MTNTETAQRIKLQDLVKKCQDPKVKEIAIVGNPMTGKTTLANLLFDNLNDVQLIHTDDYRDHGFIKCLDPILASYHAARTAEPGGKIIMEGIQVARVLREGARRNYVGRRGYLADLVIDTSPTPTYLSKFTDKQMKGWHNSILDSYKIIMGAKYPKFKHPDFLILDSSQL